MSANRPLIGLVCAAAMSAWTAAWSGCRNGTVTADTGNSSARDGSVENDQAGDVVSPTDVAPDAGTRVVLALDPGGPTDLVVDQDFVYWTSYGAGTIQRLPKTGGTPQLLAQVRRLGKPTLDVDETCVYFNSVEDTGESSYIGKIPKSGGPIAVVASGQADARRVKTKNGFVYWLTGSGPEVPGTAMRVSIGGGLVQTLTPAIYVGNAWLAVDDAFVYWTAYADLGATSGGLYRVPRDGSGPVDALATGLDSPYGIAVDATKLFVGLGFHTDATDGKINGAVLSVDKSATSPAQTTALADRQAQPLAIAVDDTSVYWGDHLSGYIMKAPKSGGPAVAIVSGEGSFESIAVDDRYVYWIFGSIGDGYVARADKNP